MAITLMNGAQEIEALTNPPPETNLQRDADGKFISPAEAKPKTVAKDFREIKDSDDGETPEWVERGKFSKEQHDIVTDVIKRSIGKKHAQARTAEEFAEEQYNEKTLAERRAEKAEQELAALKGAQPAPKVVEETQRPVRDSFKTDEEYIEAVADWKTEQKFKEREQKAIADREAERIRVQTEAAHARIAAARTVVPDFDEVVSNVDMQVPGHIAVYMQESEMFAELGYHFAKHPDALQKISDMPSRTVTDLQRVGIALSKIEGTLTPFAQKAKTSNGATPSDDEDTDGDLPSDTGSIPSPKPRAAAPVIKPLNTSSATQVEKRESNKSYDEARSDWEKRNRRNFDGRKRH